MIDDAAENRELLSLVLADLGLNTDTAENGAIGVEMAGRQHYDVILSDIQMPVMDGYEAVAAMREQGITQPVIALTANAMKGYEETILQAGFSHYMTKPIDIDGLTRLLAKLLGGTPKASAATNDPAPVAVVAEAVSTEQLSQEPIYSRLGGSEKLAPVVEKFIAKIKSQLPVFEKAVSDKNYNEIAALAHWLKGSGGTVGFNEFRDPAKALEENAKNENDAFIAHNFEQIKLITQRLRSGVKSAAPVNQSPVAEPHPALTKERGPIADSPVHSTLLAKNPAFRPLVLKFLPRLEEQLSAMEHAILHEDYTEVANLAHWLKGSGGTVGFDIFTKPAAEMEISAASENKRKLNELLIEIKLYAENIVVPGNDENNSSEFEQSA